MINLRQQQEEMINLFKDIANESSDSSLTESVGDTSINNSNSSNSKSGRKKIIAVLKVVVVVVPVVAEEEA